MNAYSLCSKISVQGETKEIFTRHLKRAVVSLAKYYQLGWIGKNYAKLQENLRPETVIVPDSVHNDQPQNKKSHNLFLTGDNLEVLKHLEYAYTGKIDIISIDPPY